MTYQTDGLPEPSGYITVEGQPMAFWTEAALAGKLTMKPDQAEVEAMTHNERNIK